MGGSVGGSVRQVAAMARSNRRGEAAYAQAAAEVEDFDGR